MHKKDFSALPGFLRLKILGGAIFKRAAMILQKTFKFVSLGYFLKSNYNNPYFLIGFFVGFFSENHGGTLQCQ
jgi:hypothetical protein